MRPRKAPVSWGHFCVLVLKGRLGTRASVYETIYRERRKITPPLDRFSKLEVKHSKEVPVSGRGGVGTRSRRYESCPNTNHLAAEPYSLRSTSACFSCEKIGPGGGALHLLSCTGQGRVVFLFNSSSIRLATQRARIEPNRQYTRRGRRSHRRKRACGGLRVAFRVCAAQVAVRRQSARRHPPWSETRLRAQKIEPRCCRYLHWERREKACASTATATLGRRRKAHTHTHTHTFKRT